jgi:hypothetical protein
VVYLGRAYKFEASVKETREIKLSSFTYWTLLGADSNALVDELVYRNLRIGWASTISK